MGKLASMFSNHTYLIYLGNVKELRKLGSIVDSDDEEEEGEGEVKGEEEEEEEEAVEEVEWDCRYGRVECVRISITSNRTF